MRGWSFPKCFKLIAAILCGLVVFAVLFSAVFIAKEADHDCSGEDCPVCACLQMCEQFLQRTLGLASGAFAAIGAAAFAAAAFIFVFADPQRVFMLRAVRLLC